MSRKLTRHLQRQTNKAMASGLAKRVEIVQSMARVRYQEQDTEQTMLMFSLVMSMACKVLCDEFHFGKLPPGEPDEKYRIVRFARAIASEVDGLDVTRRDIVKKYIDAVYKKYGVKFDYR